MDQNPDIFCPPVHALVPEHTRAQTYITFIYAHTHILEEEGGAHMRPAWTYRTAEASKKDSHSSCLSDDRYYS